VNPKQHAKYNAYHNNNIYTPYMNGFYRYHSIIRSAKKAISCYNVPLKGNISCLLRLPLCQVTVPAPPNSLRLRTSAYIVRDLTKIRNERQAELLSLRSTQTLKETLESTSSQTLRTTIPNADLTSADLEIEDANLNDVLLKKTSELAADKQEWIEESLYRMAGLTTFSVQDPAPGGGNLTGIRIEVMADGKPHLHLNTCKVIYIKIILKRQ